MDIKLCGLFCDFESTRYIRGCRLDGASIVIGSELLEFETPEDIYEIEQKLKPLNHYKPVTIYRYGACVNGLEDGVRALVNFRKAEKIYRDCVHKNGWWIRFNNEIGGSIFCTFEFEEKEFDNIFPGYLLKTPEGWVKK